MTCYPTGSVTSVPLAAFRVCAGCSTLVRGSCQTCRKQGERQRKTAHARGYTYREWVPFRRQFLAALVEAGILPICGAALPSGPAMQDSQCRSNHLFTFASDDGSSLHVDHDPPLQDHERQNTAAVCDLNRVGLLCQSCHAVKTAREAWGVAKCL